MSAEYEITYTLRRREAGDDDGREIGFGTSGYWDDPAQAAHILSSAIDTYDWETDANMPDPKAIKHEVEHQND